MHMSTLLLLGLVGAMGFICQWAAWRAKLPAILFLLLCGIILGPTTGFLDPDAVFGDLLFPFISLCVSIILFEGSLTLNRSELHDIGRSVRNMVTIGLFINGVITTLAVHYLVGFSWQLSALFGSIMVVTGPTVVVPMLRAIRPNNRIERVLRWEGIIIDPIGALLAVIVFDVILSTQQAQTTDMFDGLKLFVSTIAAGLATGALSAYVLGNLLRHNLLPDYLKNYASLAFVTLTFACSDALKHESGLVAVTVMGIWLVNMKDVHIRSILHFKENLTTVFVSILFIILAARIDFAELRQLGLGALGVFLVMQCIARPLKVFVSTHGTSFSIAEKTVIAWIGPRGIVAAAVSAVFALRLEQIGMEEARLIVPLAFSVIIGTVLVQSLTARPLAKLLGVTEPDNNGYLVVGANPVAVIISKALKDIGIHTILCDTNWENISNARMAGLSTYYGNPVSNHADLYLDTTGVGGVLGLSFDQDKNRNAALRYKEDFGINKTFSIVSTHSSKREGDSQSNKHYLGHSLFSKNATYGVLSGMIRRGAVIKKTTLSQEYTYDDWKSSSDNKTLVLFYLDDKKNVKWEEADRDFSPQPGWTIVQLAESSAIEVKEAE